MTPLPVERSEHREHRPRLAAPVPFDPNIANDRTQLAVGSLFGLNAGWYRRADLARAVAAACDASRHWATGILAWLTRDGVLLRREHRREVWLWVESERLVGAWPRFEPPRLGSPLRVQPCNAEAS